MFNFLYLQQERKVVIHHQSNFKKRTFNDIISVKNQALIMVFWQSVIYKKTDIIEKTNINDINNNQKLKNIMIFLKENIDILKNIDADTIHINDKSYSIKVLKAFDFRLIKAFVDIKNENVRSEIMVILNDKVDLKFFEKIKTIKNDLKQILLQEFQKTNSILNILQNLKKNNLKIDGKIFSFKELLKINWKAKEFKFETLNSETRAQFRKLYKVVSQKNKMKKIKNALAEYKKTTTDNSGLSKPAQVGIGVAISFVGLIIVKEIAYWVEKKKVRKTKEKQKKANKKTIKN